MRGCGKLLDQRDRDYDEAPIPASGHCLHCTAFIDQDTDAFLARCYGAE